METRDGARPGPGAAGSAGILVDTGSRWAPEQPLEAPADAWIEARALTRALRFDPPASPELRRVKEYGTEAAAPGTRADIEAMAAALTTGTVAALSQSAWMGRSCFRRTEDGDYLVAKGIGPGPGSEWTRQRVERSFRRESPRSGCLRRPTGTLHPMLVPFRQRDGAWNVIDPRPEGFASLSFLVREAEAAVVLAAAGVRVATPRLLLGRSIRFPWTPGPGRALEAFLADGLSVAIATDLGLAAADADSPVSFEGVSYRERDGGVLIGSVRSPYRIANLQLAAAERDRGWLEHLRAHALHRFGMGGPSAGGWEDLAAAFATTLAENAAAMFVGGILHGGLSLQHQNVSLAAEIADLDSAIFLPSLPGWSEIAPWPVRPPEYGRFWRNVRQAAGRPTVNIEAVVHADARRRLGATGPRPAPAAAEMLQQILQLQQHSMRAADLLRRTTTKDPDRAGTVLPPLARRRLRRCFAAAFAEHLVRLDGERLFRWAWAHGRESLRTQLLRLRGRGSLHGWSHPGVPVDHLSRRCDGARIDHIIRESDDLLRLLAHI